ncbi:hypothetical protein [Pseudoalteromonas sp. 1_2015MBL_MicDiv]|uniref:hypothetical protein n=1 Tax=Pseudoalteromonas sp. 1_2015MBL_MicDiv TaxID=1720343 RepID=UPI000BBEC5C9|nr:hypothetical protein [Pseudoalteromonas sp. 1_2015MBL_MicDiv]ATG77655.1 hypothetical protein AOR04_08965 [Pseudoalteromonas sp. 1_2015MBL_MicDiv]
MIKDRKEKITNILKPLNRNPAIYSIFIGIFVCSLFIYEFFNKFNFNLNTPLESWVATATYFNNVFSPILLFVSILLLYRTWKDSRSALELQKVELEETKLVLREQSDTQNFSVIKDAVFEIAEQTKLLSQRKVVLIQYSKEMKLFDANDESLAVENEDVDDDMKYKSTTYTIENFLHDHFLLAKAGRLSDTPRSSSQKNLIFSGQFYDYIEKVKTLALFMQALKSTEYRQILEITLFSKLTIFTWLLFVEIAFHLLITAKEGEKETAELVFLEVAGLTCKQLKEVYWITSLSDEVLLELKERKLL